MEISRSFPFDIYCDDGYIIRVATPEDLARQLQGGPFVHIPRLDQYRELVNQSYWYADLPLIMDGRHRFAGEVFPLSGTLEEWDLRQSGHIRPLSPKTRPMRHHDSGRSFCDESSYFAFLRRYKRHDLVGIVWTAATSPDTAPTVEAVGKLPTDRQLKRALRRAAREIRGVGGKVTQATIGRKLTPRRGRNTVGKFLRQLGLKITDL